MCERILRREKMFLRRVSRPLMMMVRVKETTGVVGLEVVPNAREVLINIYNKTLKEIQAVPRMKATVRPSRASRAIA